MFLRLPSKVRERMRPVKYVIPRRLERETILQRRLERISIRGRPVLPRVIYRPRRKNLTENILTELYNLPDDVELSSLELLTFGDLENIMMAQLSKEASRKDFPDHPCPEAISLIRKDETESVHKIVSSVDDVTGSVVFVGSGIEKLPTNDCTLFKTEPRGIKEEANSVLANGGSSNVIHENGVDVKKESQFHGYSDFLNSDADPFDDAKDGVNKPDDESSLPRGDPLVVGQSVFPIGSTSFPSFRPGSDTLSFNLSRLFDSPEALVASAPEIPYIFTRDVIDSCSVHADVAPRFTLVADSMDFVNIGGANYRMVFAAETKKNVLNLKWSSCGVVTKQKKSETFMNSRKKSKNRRKAFTSSLKKSFNRKLDSSSFKPIEKSHNINRMEMTPTPKLFSRVSVQRNVLYIKNGDKFGYKRMAKMSSCSKPGRHCCCPLKNNQSICR